MHILTMKTLLMRLMFLGIMLGLLIAGGMCQTYSPEFESNIDSLVAAAYQKATADFPCDVGTGGKPKMINWKDIENCLYDAEEQVNWEDLALEFESLRQKEGLSRTELTEVVESALSEHAIPYSRVFKVKKGDVLLPLSNTVLKFLPEGSFKDLPVYDKRQQKKIGTFSSKFTYERNGGLSAANTYKLSLFQYTDLDGDLQAPTLNNRLLLDSFGVPWKEASSRIGFRLSSEKLGFKY